MLLDSEEFSREDLAGLFKRRWEVESILKVLKDDLGMQHVAAKSPEMVYKKVWTTVLALNLIRWYMKNVSLLANRVLREISFTATLRALVNNSNSLLNAKTKKDLTHVRASIVSQILSHKVCHRPGRKEPRAVKKRRKPHKLLKKKRSQCGQKLAS